MKQDFILNSRENAGKSYKVEFNHEAYKLSFMGLAEKQLAYFFEIMETELDEWKIQYPEFAAAMKVGKVAAIKAWFNSVEKPTGALKKNPLTIEEIRLISQVLEEEC